MPQQQTPNPTTAPSQKLLLSACLCLVASYSPLSIAASESTASITSGVANTVEANLFTPGQRVAGMGEIEDSNGQLDESQLTELAADGEVITAYIFADNYFELYINGVGIAKDPVPFTAFNSNVVQFKVKTPFTVAMLLVDWEENLGTGTERGRGSQQQPGDGGMVAVFHNAAGEIIGITDNSWKAQTFYTAPLTDTDCLSESNNQRLSDNCSTSAPKSLDSIQAAHWPRPENWIAVDFDDSYFRRRGERRAVYLEHQSHSR